jgi:hypothetical protein
MQKRYKMIERWERDWMHSDYPYSKVEGFERLAKLRNSLDDYAGQLRKQKGLIFTQLRIMKHLEKDKKKLSHTIQKISDISADKVEQQRIWGAVHFKTYLKG